MHWGQFFPVQSKTVLVQTHITTRNVVHAVTTSAHTGNGIVFGQRIAHFTTDVFKPIWILSLTTADDVVDIRLRERHVFDGNAFNDILVKDRCPFAMNKVE
ncbi:hypothetical protein D3C86_1151510 [compost metagenome]